MNATLLRRRDRAFSLVELLIAIAVVGVIASMAVAAMSGMYDRGLEAKTLRNSQSIVSLFNAARGAGNRDRFHTVSEAVRAITGGNGLSGSGIYATARFSLPMSAEEATAATAHITLSGTPADGQMTLK